MIRAERIWKLQRGSGVMAAIFLTVALLMLLDGLRSGIFGSSQVRLAPGEVYAVSGPMPPKTERIEDFVIADTAEDGSLSLVPEGIYTGYWFGGGMWRGHIRVGAFPRPGEYTISVRDRFGEKQNPALVFAVRVFASAAERQAHSRSLVYRWTGVRAYWLAACVGLVGMAAAGGNFLLGRRWSAILAEHGCGEIFRLKSVNGRVELGVELDDPERAVIGATFRFTHPRRGDLGQGRVIALGHGEITVEAAGDVPVRLGDIACPAYS